MRKGKLRARTLEAEIDNTKVKLDFYHAPEVAQSIKLGELTTATKHLGDARVHLTQYLLTNDSKSLDLVKEHIKKSEIILGKIAERIRRKMN